MAAFMSADREPEMASVPLCRASQSLIDRLALRIAVLPVQQHDFVGIAVRCQQFGEIALGADGFGEDHGLAFSALGDDLVEGLG